MGGNSGVCQPRTIETTLFDCKQPGPWRWLRLNIYPDGGIARFRAYGNVLPDWSFAGSEIELSGLKNGGRIVAYNDAHYGNVKAVLDSGRGINMGMVGKLGGDVNLVLIGY